MKFTLKRMLAAGAIGVSAIVTPIALTVALPGVSGLTTVAGAQASGPDTITFNQPSSTPDTYVFTSPANQTTTTQQVTPSGKCGTPSVSGGSPILSLRGKEYNPTPNGNYYLNSSTSDPVSISGGVTGACNISPPQSLENKSGKGAEALDFSVLNTNTSIIGANRLITDAQMWIQRKDSGVALNPSVNVVLVEFDSSGNQVGSQSCIINGGQGTDVLADTGATTGSGCTGTPAPLTGFSTVEVQDQTTSTSISVVSPAVAGPSATFTLANSVCGGQTINSTPGANGLLIPATLTMTGTGQCKTYATFSAQPDGSLNFAGFSGGTAVSFNVTITWPKQPMCQPYSDVGDGTADDNHPDASSAPIPAALTLPVCAPHEFSVDGTHYFDQTYCQNAAPPPAAVQQQMCTVQKTYTNDTVTVAQNGNTSTTPLTITMPDGTVVPATQITETWVGDIDMYWR